MKQNKNFLVGAIGLSALVGGFSCQQPSQNSGEAKQSAQRPNVLFIAVDDLRPELNCYGETHIHSPNIDKLASEGIRFNRAYCNIPVCGASRASLLTGTRPTRDRFLHYYTRVDVEMDTVPTLPQYFRQSGYYAMVNGKVFHHPGDAAESWDEEWWPPSNSTWRDYADPENIRIDTGKHRGPAYECLNVEDNAYKDGKTAEKAIKDLQKLKDMNKPFFLGLGFFKPHLPFNAPKKYWDLYSKKDIKLPENNYKPQNAPDEAMHNWGELRSYMDIPPTGPLTDSAARQLIHGYYACVSYTDAQIGKVLKALEDLGLDDNTIVILWGDHGWNLREHGLWCKHCNFKTSLHAPIIMKAPGIEGGKETDGITGFVDIYPSLCELCNLEKPQHLEGQSFVSLLKNPQKEWKEYAVCKWFDGATYIKGQHFYTEWSDTTSHIYARMLYDHTTDPGENVNISEEESNKNLVNELSEELHERWGRDYNVSGPTTQR
jgi:iduronate 2-sulfatase